MRITSKQLEQLIKEEVARQMDEASFMQKVGSYITGKPTDDDMLAKAANEIMYEIDRTPPVWRELYDNTFMVHRTRLRNERQLHQMESGSEIVQRPNEHSGGGERWSYRRHCHRPRSAYH